MRPNKTKRKRKKRAIIGKTQFKQFIRLGFERYINTKIKNTKKIRG